MAYFCCRPGHFTVRGRPTIRVGFRSVGVIGIEVDAPGITALLLTIDGC
jgi:hypothetical protein